MPWLRNLVSGKSLPTSLSFFPDKVGLMAGQDLESGVVELITTLETEERETLMGQLLSQARKLEWQSRQIQSKLTVHGANSKKVQQNLAAKLKRLNKDKMYVLSTPPRDTWYDSNVVISSVKLLLN